MIRYRHRFSSFVPSQSEYLLLGSFVGKPEEGDNWFYTGKRNQFWSILEEVYNLNLIDNWSKRELLTHLKIALSDVILECSRKYNTNADSNLCDLVFNAESIAQIIENNPIKKVLFTSRFVEKIYKRHF
jgi:hypoxanthine-DNA glycosylase